MTPAANIALLLEQRRLKAWGLGQPSGESSQSVSVPSKSSGKAPNPPRVLVIGPESSGKTTLCKTLTNYAVRTLPGWTPILVNLDTNDVRSFTRFAK